MKRRGPGYEAMRTALSALVLGALAAFGSLIARPATAAADIGDSDQVRVRLGIRDVFPPRAVTDLVGTAGAEGQAVLQWSSPASDDLPKPKPDTVGQYLVRVATFPASALGGDTTAWFDAATPLPVPVPLAPGNDQSVFKNLEGGTSYWFGLRSVDAAGLTSLLDTKTQGVGTQVEIGVKGIAGVSNLTAFAGVLSGEVDLVWTTPRRIGQFDPSVYELRVSSLGQISNVAEFEAAKPLTAFSPSLLPAVGASPGLAAGVTVTGLQPSVTYYFALRARDGGLPPFKGAWNRNVPANLNAFNFAPARFFAGYPEAITDLTALPGSSGGSINLTWTAPRSPNGIVLKEYRVKLSSQSVAELGGDTTAWFNLAGSTTVVVSQVNPPGTSELLALSGLDINIRYYFGIKTVDNLGAASNIDLLASGAQANSRTKQVSPILNLTAVAVSTESGRIDLSWTSPDNSGLVPPLRYLISASTSANISDNAQFAAAAPLSAFSASQPPAVSSGAAASMSVTGLIPLSTYYFAIRVADSNPTLTVVTNWLRVATATFNTNNSARAPLIAGNPDAVTDLTGIASGSVLGAVNLSWTAPRNQNFTPLSSYELRFATSSVADLGGDATAWFLAAASSAAAIVNPALPGVGVTFTLTGLSSEVYFFAVRAIDQLGSVGPLDHGADTTHPRAQASARPAGVGGVTDLVAVPDGVSGAVDLSWTTPFRFLSTLPERYLLRVSTTGNMDDDAAFAAARPLSAFSPTTLPAVGLLGTRQALSVTGLAPFTTYYFAVAVEDSSAPVKVLGRWLRDAGRNPNNFAVPSFIPSAPNPISDLSALPGGVSGEMRLAWTAPSNVSFVPISSYTVRGATFSAAALGGDATAWFNAATLSYVYYPAGLPGALESLVVSGLEPTAEYFFGLRAIDQIGQVGLLDTGLDPANPAPQVSGRARGLAGVTDLSAAPGTGAGVVALTWTTPRRVVPVLPERYAVRISSLGQIASDAEFAAAKPLTAFSAAVPPAVGAAGAKQVFSITGLPPFTTYFFAVRVEDSSAPVNGAGLWLRDTLLARNTANFSVPSFFINPPEPISDLSALPGAQEGAVNLSWTAPRNQNFIPIAGYEVRFATFSVAALANNATAWFNAVTSSASLAPAAAPGAREQLTLSGLYPDSTFYFAVRSVDSLGETSPVDLGADASDPRPQAFVKPLNLPPAVPSGLAIVNGLKRVSVSWNDLAAGLGGKGLDFSHYRLQRSTDNAQFVYIASQTALSYMDRPLRAETSYYFRVTAQDLGGLESAPSASAASLPFTLAPQEPFGLRFSRNGSSVTLAWAPTTRFETTEEFFSSTAPASDELSGYSIYRSTGACSPFVPHAAYGLSASSHTEADTGQSNFYKVQAVNDFKLSTAALVLSPFGDQIHSLPDCASSVIIPEILTRELLSGANGLGADIYLQKAYRLEQNGGEVLQTVEFIPLAGGGAAVKNFAFKKPVRIALRYQTDAQGSPVPATAQAVAADAAAVTSGLRLESVGQVAAAADPKNLGMYWNDGKDFKKLYGQVDPVAQTVAVETPNLGAFQIRRVFRDSAATFDISNITTKVITPNGDGKNDLMIMLFDNPKGASVSGKIYDLRGAFVSAMAAGPNGPNSLQWDGMMGGKPVTSGVYVYQVEGDGKLFNGTCVVAR